MFLVVFFFLFFFLFNPDQETATKKSQSEVQKHTKGGILEMQIKRAKGKRVGHVPTSCSASQGPEGREGKVRSRLGVEATFLLVRNPKEVKKARENSERLILTQEGGQLGPHSTAPFLLHSYRRCHPVTATELEV